jgi:hypothetical protein
MTQYTSCARWQDVHPEPVVPRNHNAEARTRMDDTIITRKPDGTTKPLTTVERSQVVTRRMKPGGTNSPVSRMRCQRQQQKLSIMVFFRPSPPTFQPEGTPPTPPPCSIALPDVQIAATSLPAKVQPKWGTLSRDSSTRRLRTCLTRREV